MSDFVATTRKTRPNEVEFIPSGTSPGWMKSNNFNQHYNSYDDNNESDQEDFLKTSHGDGSIFIDDYSTQGDFDENYLPSELLDDLYSKDSKIRTESLERIMEILEEDFKQNRTSFYSNSKSVIDAINVNSFNDLKDRFDSFQKTLPHVYKHEELEAINKENVSPSPPNSDDFIEKLSQWHPTYFEKYISTFDFIMRSDGPLPHHLRHYFAILSASRFKCLPIIKQQETEFLLNGGDPSWLEDLNNASPKMKAIFELNQILAHQPWLIKTSDIEKILKGDHLWTLAELLHASIIMAYFRTICSIYFGMSVIPENNKYCSTEDEQLIESLCIDTKEEKVSKEQNKKCYEEAETETPNQTSNDQNIWDEVKQYIGEYTMVHQNFDIKSKEYSIFRFNEFTWDEEGFETLQRYYDAASLIDDKFKVISNLTYNKIKGKEGVDTGPFRRAIWNYTHRVLGIEHDDYTYSLVNKILRIPMKAFVKNLVCKPYEIKPSDLEDSSFNLYPDEICHIVILAAESRLQGELLYLLRAINNYLSFL